MPALSKVEGTPKTHHGDTEQEGMKVRRSEGKKEWFIPSHLLTFLPSPLSVPASLR
jgi:hypothetical protein